MTKERAPFLLKEETQYKYQRILISDSLNHLYTEYQKF